MAERERNEMLGFAPPVPMPDEGSGELVDRSELPDPPVMYEVWRGSPFGWRLVKVYRWRWQARLYVACQMKTYFDYEVCDASPAPGSGEKERGE